MPDLPTFDVSYESRILPRQSQDVDFSDDQSPHIRIMGGQWYDMSIIYPAMSAVDKDTLINFYRTNKGVLNNYTDPGEGIVYNCYFTVEPQVISVPVDVFNVTVLMVGEQI